MKASTTRGSVAVGAPALNAERSGLMTMAREAGSQPVSAHRAARTSQKPLASSKRAINPAGDGSGSSTIVTRTSSNPAHLEAWPAGQAAVLARRRRFARLRRARMAGASAVVFRAAFLAGAEPLPAARVTFDMKPR